MLYLPASAARGSKQAVVANSQFTQVHRFVMRVAFLDRPPLTLDENIRIVWSLISIPERTLHLRTL